MYCLEKLQRELAYFFDMDLRELPKVESLLAEAGYTQIRKGNDIIEIDSALGRYSADLGDSSVETKELHTKTTSKLTKDELDNLPIATAQEYGEFLEKIAQKDYQNTPEILKIATLNNDLQELINNNHSASVFITRARAGHISEVRKGEYDQALTLEEQKQIPAEIAQAKQAYTDDKSSFILPFADKNNSEKINLIILDSDSKGNFLITAKKVNSAELNNPKYKKLARAGVEPATTTPPKAEQKPTEAISLARDEIIPQTQISNIKKQLVELKESKSAYEKYLKSLERNMKDAELEERRYLRGEERIKVFERKRLIQSSIDEHTQGLNAVLKKMIELHKQLPENVRYTKEVLDDLTKIEAILKGNDYSLEQALRLSKITQRLQEKAIIESESFLNEVYNLDDFAKGAKSLQGTSYAYNTDDTIRKYFKIIAEMIDSIPAFKKISANQPETLPKVDSSEAPPSKINFTYTTGEAKGIAELRKDLKQALEPYKSTPITNKETGLQGVVTDTERNKISSKKAVDKSIANGFTRDEHFTAAQDLKNLFENATKAQSHNDYKQRENIAQVHRFVKDLYINDKQAQAKITLFEKIEGKNRIYTLELESLSPTPQSSPHTQAGVAVEAQVTRDVVRPNANIAKTDEQIVAQDSNALLESTMQKFNYDERKAKDLLEWHKDSSPLTKDENGVPKVFYHGTGQKEFDPFSNKYVNFEVFKTTLSKQDDDFLKGHYFSSNIKIAKTYNNNIYKVFLNAKNPLVIDFKGHTFNDYIDEAIDNIPKSVQENIRDFYDSIIFKNIIDDSTQNGKKHPVADTIMVFNSNQIKHINNKGSYTDTKGNITKDKPKGVESTHTYFNEKSPNIFHSNPHAGAGLLGGSVAGIEQDENGNITFNPEKFALGLLGGAVGSKAVSSGIKWRANKVKKAYPNIAKDNPTLMQEIAKRDLQTYAMTNTHNALTRFLNKNKALDINPQLFAGEKALVNESYAPHKARLERAKELESSFLDSSGRIDYRALMDKAEALPEQVRFTRFKEMIFTNPNARQIDSKNAVIQTPAGEVKVNVLRAFNHYFKQGKHGNKKENRQVFNATFMPTLLQPKFVTKDEAGTLYYYKPFVSKDKEYHITSIAVKRDGNLEYATSYNATDNRLKQMIKHNELVYFESGLS